MPAKASHAFLLTFSIGSFLTRCRLHWRYGFDWRYFHRVVFLFFIGFITVPLRMTERLLYARRIARTKLDHPPIFIVGHWRSGTTHLHMLLTQDHQFGFLPNYHVFGSKWAELCEIPALHSLIDTVMPPTRDFDNVELKTDSPQEDELAIADRLPYSTFHHWCFPRSALDLLRYVTFENVPQYEIDHIRVAYTTILKKASLIRRGTTLIVKNPANGGRMEHLMKWFPGSKFIHIYRNPYKTAQSFLNMQRVMCTACSVHVFDEKMLWRNTLEFIKAVEGKFLKDRDLIPKGDLTEVGFEDLMHDPLPQLERMYKELGLKSFEETKQSFIDYVASQEAFVPNAFRPMEPSFVADVNKHLGFIFDTWGYEKQPTTSQPTF
eukprot:TRINITY_DN18920_c0_g1_i1.p1 TRINITY_DN18920_c0_g1~~TRINITY_DN18920_c0_g1_i1.p1  ORF type:complete len:402 (-),score=74.00 TRINITY_DN18920_c0_g1_i1:37-1170(-)